MESPSKEEKVIALDSLHQQYNDLVQHWDTINQSNPKTLRGLSSTGSRTVFKDLQVLDSSPRSLMSFLQFTPSPTSERDVVWKVRNNDLAVEEILGERRAAVRSGKLKGRRLFPVVEGVSDHLYSGVREEISCRGWYSVGGESEERSLWSYDYSDDENENVGSKKGLSPVCHHFAPVSTYSSSPPSSVSYEKVVVEEKEMVDVATVEVKKGLAETGLSQSRTREKVIMVWLGILLTALAIGFIIARTLSGYGGEVIPIPT